jgi:hypothetical protein
MEARHNMKITERIHNLQTGETLDIERDETAAETKARLDNEKFATEEAAKAAEKAALLERLGISAEEAKLLLS